MTVLLVALTMTTSVVTAFSEPSRYYNDGGKGNDGGNTRAEATMLPGFGTYGGYHLPYDNDWYAVNSTASAPTCIQSNILSQVTSKVILAVEDGAKSTEIEAWATVGTELPMAIATRAHNRVLFNSNGTHSNARGDYIFEINRTNLSDLVTDAGTGRDASSMISRATPVPGHCFAGSLDPKLGLGDTRDAYSFNGTAGQVVILSYAPTIDAGTLTVFGTDGSTVLGTIGPGGIAAITLPETGTFSMTAASMGTVDFQYIIGFIPGPPGSSCRPNC